MKSWRSLFISDCHLGSHNCQGERFYRFLCANNATTIYLIGDIIEMNVMDQWPPYHIDCLKELIHKAQQGTEIIYIPGNHDKFFRNHIGDYGSMEIVKETIHVRPNRQFMLVIHGDEKDYFQSNWFLQLVTWLDRGLGANLWELLRTHASWWISHHNDAFEHRMIKYAKERNFKGVICGHVHLPTIKIVDDILLLNCGDWTHHCTAITEDEFGKFEMQQG